jgi:drug/metabolite transporter (DMT)-like permease
MKTSEIANQQPDTKIIIFVILLALLWGGNSVSIKIGLQDIPPLALAGFRFLLGLLAVGCWSVTQRIRIAMNSGEFVPLTCLSVIFLLQIISLNVVFHQNGWYCARFLWCTIDVRKKFAI